MRKAALITLAAFLTFVFCGHKQVTSSAMRPADSSQSRVNSQMSKQATSSGTWPHEACDTLTEAEMARFIKVLPAFSAAAKAAGWKPPPKGEGGSVGVLVPLVEGMNVAGTDESLKKVGSDWNSVRATLYKIIAAHAAASIDRRPPAMIEQMKNDTSAAVKKAYQDYQNMKAVCAKVPAANKEIVQRHEQDLTLLRTLGH